MSQNEVSNDQSNSAIKQNEDAQKLIIKQRPQLH
jgi:hypothetical protein